MRTSEDGGQGIYSLRKRRRGRVEDSDEPRPVDKLLAAAEQSRRIIVFSGSGLSATSGMSTFSTRGGLYERAQKKFKLSDGKMLFTYAFFDKRRPEAQAFIAEIYAEATKAQPAPGHYALSTLLEAGRLQRHYTMNIDGLAGAVGMDSWHPETNPDGITVEMHGNVHFMVCVECGGTLPLTAALARQLKAQQPVPCQRCSHEAMRFKVMMYEDAESEAITPEEVMDLMEGDVKQADLILWVGISFQQSASTVYFRNVRKWLAEAGRLEEVLQAVINPSDEALWNLMTATSNQSNLNVVEVLEKSDEILPQLADRLARQRFPGANAAPPQGQEQQRLRRQRSPPNQEEQQLWGGHEEQQQEQHVHPHAKPQQQLQSGQARPLQEPVVGSRGNEQVELAQQQQQQQHQLPQQGDSAGEGCRGAARINPLPAIARQAAAAASAGGDAQQRSGPHPVTAAQAPSAAASGPAGAATGALLPGGAGAASWQHPLATAGGAWPAAPGSAGRAPQGTATPADMVAAAAPTAMELAQAIAAAMACLQQQQPGAGLGAAAQQ